MTKLKLGLIPDDKPVKLTVQVPARSTVISLHMARYWAAKRGMKRSSQVARPVSFRLAFDGPPEFQKEFRFVNEFK